MGTGEVSGRFRPFQASKPCTRMARIGTDHAEAIEYRSASSVPIYAIRIQDPSPFFRRLTTRECTPVTGVRSRVIVAADSTVFADVRLVGPRADPTTFINEIRVIRAIRGKENPDRS